SIPARPAPCGRTRATGFPCCKISTLPRCGHCAGKGLLRPHRLDYARTSSPNCGVYPPVTLICRDTEGRDERRSMTKSCPRGLSKTAASIACSRGLSPGLDLIALRRLTELSCPRHE